MQFFKGEGDSYLILKPKIQGTQLRALKRTFLGDQSKGPGQLVSKIASLRGVPAVYTFFLFGSVILCAQRVLSPANEKLSFR